MAIIKDADNLMEELNRKYGKRGSYDGKPMKNIEDFNRQYKKRDKPLYPATKKSQDRFDYKLYGWDDPDAHDWMKTPTPEQQPFLWQLQQRQDEFRKTMDEEARRYDQDFGESSRQFDEIFGEGVRREDRGFEEEQRRFNLGEDKFRASQARGEEASGQYDQLFNTPLAELGQYEQAIIDQSTPGQEQARQATIAALARQGVRGPQAALETSRQAGMMGQDLQNQLAGAKFKEAMDRRAARGKLKGEMSLQGLGGGL